MIRYEAIDIKACVTNSLNKSIYGKIRTKKNKKKKKKV